MHISWSCLALFSVLYLALCSALYLALCNVLSYTIQLYVSLTAISSLNHLHYRRERNFHIFYYLLSGLAEKKLLSKYKLKGSQQYRFAAGQRYTCVANYNYFNWQVSEASWYCQSHQQEECCRRGALQASGDRLWVVWVHSAGIKPGDNGVGLTAQVSDQGLGSQHRYQTRGQCG